MVIILNLILNNLLLTFLYKLGQTLHVLERSGLWLTIVFCIIVKDSLSLTHTANFIFRSTTPTCIYACQLVSYNDIKYHDGFYSITISHLVCIGYWHCLIIHNLPGQTVNSLRH